MHRKGAFSPAGLWLSCGRDLRPQMQAMSEPLRTQSSRVGPGVEVGITEELIRDLVHAFYARVRKDDLLGPIFNREVDDWDEHLARLCDFWSSVMLMTGRYHGAPMPAHARLDEVGPAHFAHWLELFEATARDVCPAEAAAMFVDRARRIARSLQMGMAVVRGELPPLHQRLSPG